ncbi:MAG: CHC2 zinc finger domain-containing protein [Rhodocyclales bacterium]|nr:CHC2 zinc finger domain-containing protein [Rhodocyclales bacterium]
MKLKKTKPSNVCRRQLGQQHNFRGHAAYGNYTKPLVKKSRPPLPSPAEFYASQISGFVERGDDWAWGCCPFHDDHNPSFCMHLRTGWYQCKSSNCGETGKNIVGFVCARDGLSVPEAIRFLEGWI